MEVGPEISRKIRSAIKAKLVDLGAYVDDELPDYIMVMVANKKTKEQMTNDLQLFLGKNTEKFTTWLTSVLDKLQSITGDDPEPTSSTEKPAATSQKDKDNARATKKSSAKVKKSSTREKRSRRTDKSSEKEKTKTHAHDNKDHDTKAQRVDDNGHISTTNETTSKHEDNGVKLSDGNREESTEKNPAKREGSPLLVLKPDADEFAEEATSVVTDEPDTRTVQKHPETAPQSQTAATVKVSPTRAKPSKSHSKHVDEPREVPVTRKRKLQSSVRGTQSYVDVEEEDEEYDPLNPSVGNVASIIKVTERKSTIPRSRQASKSLLMKAVTEANQSVVKSKVVKKDEDIVPDISKQDNNLRRRRTPAKASSFAKPPLMSRILQDEDLKFKADPTIIEVAKGEDEPPMKVKAWSPDDNRCVLFYEEDENHQSSETVKRQDSSQELIVQHPKTERVATVKPRKNVIERLESETTTSQNEHLLHSENVVVNCEQKHLYERKNIYAPEQIDTDIHSDQYSYQPDIPKISPRRKERPRSTSQVMDPHLPSPKFIVTLDGVDASRIEVGESMDEDNDSGSDYLPMPLISSTPLSAAYPNRLKDSNYAKHDQSESEFDVLADEDEPMDVQETINERCRFWPACKNSETCQYVHPSIHCKAFPFCKFGDKCLYIHPNCKFDAFCTNVKCPYTHACKRNPIAIAAATAFQMVNPRFSAPPPPRPPPQSANHRNSNICKFFPKCTNMSCSFVHPKPCRFGISCNSKESCMFYHPPVPVGDKLKWTASSATSDPNHSFRDGKFVLAVDDTG
ncbi:zinc finger CCCH domain-containing protein 14-like isoform X3 [Tubulanus polymorphus]|uniref:zinc finger CCCH domain-containing protein 14-like isoform X3 n=1 Tax=Tubulanus polymorphus TaxID=672921 RepID=UPI003DA49034